MAHHQIHATKIANTHGFAAYIDARTARFHDLE